MAINFLGTWEQKENKTGNTGTNTYFREHQNRINTFRELTWEPGGPPYSSRVYGKALSLSDRSLRCSLLFSGLHGYHQF